MVDWSQLPPELLTLIAKCLETSSVCSLWRCSSFPPKVIYTFPRFPKLKIEDHSIGGVNRITRNTFYLVRLPGANQTAPARACWLVNLRDDGIGTGPMKKRLLKPLAEDSELDLPKVLDLTKFQVIELGHQYVGQYGTSTEHGNIPML